MEKPTQKELAEKAAELLRQQGPADCINGHVGCERVMPKPEVLVRAGGISEMTLWRWIKSGSFPKPLKIGPHRVGWLESEFLAWLAARAAERDRAA